ncbi:MAG: cupin domain-containing protein [Mangrovicoccus sp.]
MPKLDLSKLTPRTGSIYPAPYAEQMKGRSSLRLGQAGGLTQFGANLVILAPGARSSLRHWHLNEDEFVMVTQGQVILHDDLGETVMQVGDCAAFPAGAQNGHCFENQSDQEARFLVVGTKAPREEATYSDIDLKVTLENGEARFTHKDGRPYAASGEENNG